MSLFLITFFLLYGSLHFYLLVKARQAFPLGLVLTIALVLFILLMISAPLIVFFLEKYGFLTEARFLAFVGYCWMGFVFLCFCCLIFIDLYRLFILAGSLIFPGAWASLTPAAKYYFPLSLLLSLTIALYGYSEAQNIRTERIVISSPKIPMDAGGLKIVQISDVHLGMIVRHARLSKIVREVEKANPDLFISTGDLVDGQINNLAGLAEILREINPRYGKFAITGNHEFYAGLAQSLDFTRQAGFTILRGEGLTIAGRINLAGIDDPAGKSFGLYREVSEKDLLSNLPREKFTILLKHRPEVERTALASFDLQISGHTHKGQIFPFRLLSRIFYPYYGGSFQLAPQATLHVSRGSGTWGPPIRFLTPPEVTVYELLPANK